MITEISPIFGLSLLELLEMATILIPFAIAGSAGVTGWFSYKSIQQSKKQMAEQLDMQNRIASANLVTKYKGAWRVGGEFTAFLGKIKDPDMKVDPTKPIVYSTLDHFEDIAILWHEKVLDFNQIKEFFGTNLSHINNNKSLMACVCKDDKYYANLRELLEKIGQ